ncbi:MAG TPA: response regulator [Rhabdochlamydiaceae bacterium]|nr:response regulator [Rhabdochlamydiaceae bacterium]
MSVSNTARILCVDDNAMQQRILINAFKKNGYEAHLAKDGAEAVKMAEENHYDLILMDAQMPNMKGGEASEIIFQKNRTVTIIAQSDSKEHEFNEVFQRVIDDKEGLYQSSGRFFNLGDKFRKLDDVLPYLKKLNIQSASDLTEALSKMSIKG